MQIILTFPDDMTTEEVEAITHFYDLSKGTQFSSFKRIISYEIKYTRCQTCKERIQKGDEFQECGKKGLCVDVKPRRICPNCNGTGNLPILNKKVPIIICDICGGSGNLPDDLEYNSERGKQLKDERIHSGEGYKSLLLYCEWKGLAVLERSWQERGYFRKVKP